MKNPLNKRLPREFKSELTKYLAIFFFMTATIAFISGFLVAGGSMKQAYDESFEKYNIEDGHFVAYDKLDEASIEKIENNAVTLYESFYIDADTDTTGDGEYDSTLRVFINRDDINKVCVMEGKLPVNDNEIAIDRMFADNNNLNVGDTITVKNKKLEITGLVALSDYSALFENNTDLMFDALKFGVCVVNKNCFEAFDNLQINYGYSFLFNEQPKDEAEAKEMSDQFVSKLVFITNLIDYIPEYSNQAIHFTGDDIGGDRTMMIVLLYILIIILAFVFVITINHTISKEAAVIGTLRASGYSKGELLRHYLAIPMSVTLLSALIGNILGYTVFKNMVAALYYNSYSLPTYKTIWNGTAFVLTTIVPMLIMLVVNLISLSKKLKLSPLKFLRRDLSKSRRKKAVKLPHFKFFNRFRLRIIIQNSSNYLTLFVGIVFANILLLFGMMMSPLLKHYQSEITDNMICDYQYLLKAQVEVLNENAEKYSAYSLKIASDDGEGEKIAIYGIDENSKYISEKMPDDGVIISDSYADKYNLEIGDTIKLKEIYDDKEYNFKIEGIKVYPSTLCIFMSNDKFCSIFEKEEGYFNGYFSNEKLDELDDKYIASIISEEDLTKVSRQLTKSMGQMFYLINVFAVVLSALLIYLLTKLIIEKNTNSISMVKILGYNNGEIGRLYLMATTWVMVVSVVISMFLATVVIESLYYAMMKDYSGWLTMYIGPETYVEMFVIVVVVYALVALLQFRRIKRIPMDEALKNVE